MEEQLAGAAAHHVPPQKKKILSLSVLPQQFRSPLPCVPAVVRFERAICSSSQRFWHRGEWAMWREVAATGQKGPLARFLSTYRFIPFLVHLLLVQQEDICTEVISR